MKYRLKELREDRDIKQQVVADVLNMTRTNYSRIENELVTFSFDDAVKLAKFYDISLEELIEKKPKNLIISKEEYQQIKKTANLLLELEGRLNK